MSDRKIKSLAKDHHLNPEQVRELFRLLEQGYSAPYITIYRKDLAGHLTAEDIAKFRTALYSQQKLDKERNKILSKLKDQGIEDEDLIQNINSAGSLKELFDYYVPYRPRRQSQSRLAQSQGLAELARQVVEHELDHSNLEKGAEKYVNPEVGINTTVDVLQGAFHIINDWVAEEKTHRDMQRRVLDAHGRLLSYKSGKWDKETYKQFFEYDAFAAKLSKIHPSQTLCIMRGHRLNALRYRIDSPIEKMYLQAAELYLEGGESEFYEIDSKFHDRKSLPEGEELTALTGPELLYWCIRESLAKILAPILSKEKIRDLRQEAGRHALNLARKDLRSKLMMSPIEEGKKVLGIDPGFRTGCKLAALDENGELLDSKIVHPHTPKFNWEEAKSTIVELINTHNLTAAALGDGNGRDETEKLLGEVIDEGCSEFSYAVLNSSPADTYAKSSNAKKELADTVDKKMYKAVALARQLIQPLEELTKGPLHNLCDTKYFKEINQTELEKELNCVAEDCVGAVGPDINTSPTTLLQYVPGLNYQTARNIKEWMGENGPLAARRAIRQIPDINVNMWYRAAPFIKVNDSDNPLDRTRIHPDHYRIAEAVLEQIGLTKEDLKDEEKREMVKTKKGSVDLNALEEKFDMHYLYLKHIIDELITPWPDPRKNMPSLALRKGRPTFEQLEQFQMLHGIVQKVVDFGVFVDIGVGEDGLVHISEISENFVESPYDVVFPGQEVTVWVVDVDPKKKRIALSMRSKESAMKAADKRAKIEKQKQERKKAAQKIREAHSRVPEADLPSSMQQTKSAAGKQSRRMEKIKSFSGQKGNVSGAGKTKKGDGKTQKAPDHEKDPQKEGKEGGNLLERLQFAAIEKRGKEKD